MFARTAMFMGILWMPSHSLAEQPRHSSGPVEQRALADSRVCNDPFASSRQREPAGGGILPGRQMIILRQIAIYASMGNRDGVAMLTAQLRALGVSPEAISDATLWAKIHETAPEKSLPDVEGRGDPHPEPGWEASQ